MRIALGIEYNGNGFCGWQSQKQQPTIQDAITHALSRVADDLITVHAAGRTDANVHACLMPAHFTPPIKRPLSAWVRGTNAHLPKGIRVRFAKETVDSFHARYMAQSRHYQYVLVNHTIQPAILRHHSGFCPVPLDLDAMHEAARCLVGEHDFSSFRAASCQAGTPVRQLFSIKIERQREFIVFTFCGNAFLQRMVRNLVSALVYVGKGKQPPQWMATLLMLRDRRACPPTIAAQRLYFNGATYPRHLSLPCCCYPCPLLS